MNKLHFLLAIALLASFRLAAQLITVTPALPTDQNSVEVIFDAALGNKGLMGYTGDVYAHTGVITNLSTSSSDWKYVKSGWGVNIPACKLTPLGNDKWKLVISPSIREYYNVPATEEIKKLAFVFRSGVQVGGSWLEGKTAEGGDIFYDVFTATLNVMITQPSENFVFLNLNESLNIAVSSQLADSTSLYIGNTRVATTNANSINYTHTATSYGQVLVKAIAKSGSNIKTDSFYYYVRPTPTVAALPPNVHDGINYLSNSSVILSLYAPLKQYAFAIGDFNNWMPGDAGYMKQTPDGKRYWLQVDGLVPGKEYIFQYLVDGSIRIGDPYTEKVSDPWNDSYIKPSVYPGTLPYPIGKTTGIASVLQTGQTAYNWKQTSFQVPKATDLVIYELLVRDFTAGQSFQGVIDTIGYLWKLGINAIELMPVNEFEGNLSWGYNPNYYLAPDKYYGPADKLKQLIDTCHALGIAVISDIALNHAFGTSPYVMLYWDAANNRPAANSPFYNPVAKHDFNVGYDMNHESADTKAYVGRILRHWLTEYKIDGFRFDLSKGFTQNNTLGNTAAWGNYDASRINILSAYYDTIKKYNSNAVLILEHFADNSEEKVLAAKGMLLWGNLNYAYNEAAMGFTATSDLSWGSYKARGFDAPNLVTYMESHDEERQMYKCLAFGSVNGSYSIKDTATALARAALDATFFYTLPGPKMLWQFGERGYDYSINWPTGTSASRLDQKPARWDYLNQTARQKLLGRVAGLIALKTENPVFETTDFDYSLSGAIKNIRLRNGDISMVAMGNFDTKSILTPGVFYSPGTWYEFFTGDSLVVTDVNQNLTLGPGSYKLYFNHRYAFPQSDGQVAADNRPELEVCPNPVSDKCRINALVKLGQYCLVQIMGLDGKRVATLYQGNSGGEIRTEWQPAVSGAYLLHVQCGTQTTTKKILVVK